MNDYNLVISINFNGGSKTIKKINRAHKINYIYKTYLACFDIHRLACVV